jgi:uncharacterized membrane protein YkoI
MRSRRFGKLSKLSKLKVPETLGNTVNKLGTLAATAIMSALALAMAGGVHAQIVPVQVEQNQLDRRGSPRDIRNNPQAEGRISERQAVNLARQRFPGNILRISLVGEGEHQRYQIRMENEGKVFTVFVHAVTGRVTGGN